VSASTTTKRRLGGPTHTSLPSVFAFILTAADVFLRMFFFPEGQSVEVHVGHGSAPGGAVRQSMSGRLEDAPVPRKMNSTSSVEGQVIEGARTVVGEEVGSRDRTDGD
jgi:hypothetical protein